MQLDLGFERHTSFISKEDLNVEQIDVLMVLQKHKGEDNFINSYDIAKSLSIEVTHTNQKIRKICKELLAAGYPIVSGQKGFYMAANYSELVKYRDNIKARAQGLQRTLNDLNNIISDFAQKDGF